MKKHIKLKFCIPWLSQPETFLIYKILAERYEVELTDDPDYVFFDDYPCNDWDEHLKYNAIKIFYSGENYITHYPHTNFALSYYRGECFENCLKFNSTICLPEFQYMFENNLGFNWKWNDSFLNRDFCSTVYSNSICKERNKFLKKLNRYRRVASGGKHKNNVGGPVKDKIQFQNNYKFCMCFENYQDPGYCTEKIVDAFSSNSIPIYWGDTNIFEIFNEKCFINVKDKKDFKKKLALIKEIDNNDELYKSYWDNYPLIDKNYFWNEYEKLKNYLYEIFDKNLSDIRN